MRRLLAVLALLVALTSAVWGVGILRQDVEMTPENRDGLTCGSVFASLQGDPRSGGEMPYPDNWIATCRDAARDDIPWIVAPAVTGIAALMYLTGSFIRLTRRAKAEGRSRGALT